jgi:starch-binding outer membrane protein, SusD/RagB family
MENMKKIFNIIIIIILSMNMSSCSKFLETNPSTDVADTDVFTTVNGAQSALYGCYFQMESGSGGTNRADDWGYPTHQMTFDACGEDVIVWGGWYSFDYQFWGHTRGDIFKSSALWNFYYRLINNTNSIIKYIDLAEGPKNQKDNIKGQALALRGWSYFNLIRLYQHTYNVAKNMPGVPIYTEPTTEITEGAPRGTVEDTYKQILADFNEAEVLLANFQRGANKNHIDLNVLQGLMSEVYLTMNNWDKAAEYARKGREGYPLTTNSEYLSGFNDLNTNSWIWGIPQTKKQNMGDYSPFAMWANWSRKGWSFQCFFLSDEFVKLYNDGDIRKEQIGWVWDQINTSDKFRDKDDLLGSMVIMRSDVLLLNEAEALARGGKEGEAKNLIWQLQEMRGANKTTSYGKELVEDILKERRKELYGEGYSWFDIIRCQKQLERKGNHINYGGYKPFPKFSWRFVYQIPENEMTNNKSLKAGVWPNGDQNPFEGVYSPIN